MYRCMEVGCMEKTKIKNNWKRVKLLEICFYAKK